MKDWSVELEAVGGADGQVLDEDRIDDLVEVLSQDSAAVSYLPDRYSVRLSVQADDIRGAVQEAIQRVSAAVERSGLPSWPFVQVTAQTAEELDRDLAHPTIPELLGVAELAERLGVTKQRASNLAKDSCFPKPLTVLASGPIWAESTVARYTATWARRPGRRKSP
jgi:hypothetical protein